MAPPCVVFFYFFSFVCRAFYAMAHVKARQLPCVLDRGAWQGIGITVRFLPAHGKGRNVPFGVGAVSCFSLPCASP
jgi:hypothetical protein